MLTLAGYAGANATVNVITQRPGYDEQIVVAGAFSSAGSLYCPSVCLWNSDKLQWQALATGLQGVVGAVDFAGVRPPSSPCAPLSLSPSLARAS